jgi:ATP-dependent DNA ligase
MPLFRLVDVSGGDLSLSMLEPRLKVLRPLPDPMLARSGDLPSRGRWAYEVKWDGFRAIVRAGAASRVRSRRAWDMTALVPELK